MVDTTDECTRLTLHETFNLIACQDCQISRWKSSRSVTTKFIFISAQQGSHCFLAVNNSHCWVHALDPQHWLSSTHDQLQSTQSNWANFSHWTPVWMVQLFSIENDSAILVHWTTPVPHGLCMDAMRFGWRGPWCSRSTLKQQLLASMCFGWRGRWSTIKQPWAETTRGKSEHSWQKLSMTHTESDVHAPGPALHPSNAKEANEEGNVKVNSQLDIKSFWGFCPLQKSANASASSWYIQDAFARSSQEWLHLKLHLLCLTGLCGAWQWCVLHGITRVLTHKSKLLHQLFNPDSAVEETVIAQLLNGDHGCWMEFHIASEDFAASWGIHKRQSSRWYMVRHWICERLQMFIHHDLESLHNEIWLATFSWSCI